jgi:hypothetical protein
MKCDGNCEEYGGHSGEVVKCHVYDPISVYDWGYFNYCKTAIEVDSDSGLDVIEIGDHISDSYY